MKGCITAHWHFSRFMTKGFLKLQLFDLRNNLSFFCEEIPEFASGDRDIYGFDN